MQNLNRFKILGLDISSTATGWAVINEARELVDYGLIKPKGEPYDRLQFTKTALIKILVIEKPDYICIEDMIAFRNGLTTKLLNAFSGVCGLAAFEFNGRPPRMIASSSIKAFLGVNPRAIKRTGGDSLAVKEAVYTAVNNIYKLDIHPADPRFKNRHDISDAIGAALKYYEELKP